MISFLMSLTSLVGVTFPSLRGIEGGEESMQMISFSTFTGILVVIDWVSTFRNFETKGVGADSDSNGPSYPRLLCRRFVGPFTGEKWCFLLGRGADIGAISKAGSRQGSVVAALAGETLSADFEGLYVSLNMG